MYRTPGDSDEHDNDDARINETASVRITELYENRTVISIYLMIFFIYTLIRKVEKSTKSEVTQIIPTQILCTVFGRFQCPRTTVALIRKHARSPIVHTWYRRFNFRPNQVERSYELCRKNIIISRYPGIRILPNKRVFGVNDHFFHCDITASISTKSRPAIVHFSRASAVRSKTDSRRSRR